MNASTPSLGDFSNGTHQIQYPSSSSSAGSSSSSSNNTITPHQSFSDEDVILASTRPKKRAGRRIFKETRHPVYRGVRLRDNTKWVCEMRVPNNNKSRIWLGSYPTPEMAARAHDVAALTFRGKSACLNFADSAWRVKLPVSTDAVDIRRAAMEAAQMFSAHDENSHQTSDHYLVSSVGVEVENKVTNYNEIALQQHGIIDMYGYEEQVSPLVSAGFGDMYDMPIMSPPPSMDDFTISDYSYDHVEIFDIIPVSLWDF